jgi:hypothetical protein
MTYIYGKEKIGVVQCIEFGSFDTGRPTKPLYLVDILDDDIKTGFGYPVMHHTVSTPLHEPKILQIYNSSKYSNVGCFELAILILSAFLLCYLQ